MRVKGLWSCVFHFTYGIPYSERF